MSITAVTSAPPADLLRRLRVGEVLGPDAVGRRGARRLDATAFILPGRTPIASYARALEDAAADFAAWDGAVRVLPSDGAAVHRVVIVDRYGQVYAVTDTENVAELPDPAGLEDWFRFLATACPECGVLDDPRERTWVP